MIGLVVFAFLVVIAKYFSNNISKGSSFWIPPHPETVSPSSYKCRNSDEKGNNDKR